jgi:hypothetical protein
MTRQAGMVAGVSRILGELHFGPLHFASGMLRKVQLTWSA